MVAQKTFASLNAAFTLVLTSMFLSVIREQTVRLSEHAMNHRYDLLKARREALDLSFEEAAGRAGLGKGTVHKSERPNADPCSSTIRKLAKAYKIKPSYILDFDISVARFLRVVGNGKAAR